MAGRVVEAWGRFLACPEAKQDGSYQGIKQVVDRLSKVSQGRK